MKHSAVATAPRWAAFLSSAALLTGCPPPPDDDTPGCDLLAGDLVISELLCDPPGRDEGKEWIEIYNAASGTLNLEGMEITNSAADGSRPAVHLMRKIRIEPGDYLVLGNVVDRAMPAYVDYGYGDDLGGLRNTEGRLALRCQGKLVDQMSYADTREAVALAFDGSQPPDAVANDDATRWCQAQTLFQSDASGTPGAPNDRCGPTPEGQCTVDGVLRDKVRPEIGDLVITELMPDPSGEDASREWFEIYVAGGRDVDLNGLGLSRSATQDEVTLPEGECLPARAGTWLLFAQSQDSAANGGLPATDHSFDFSLRNTDGALYLRLGEQILDAVTYGASSQGISRSLDPEHLDPVDNDDPALWCAGSGTYGVGGAGTPGAANPSCGLIPAGHCLIAGGSRLKQPPAPGDLVITEIMANPLSVDTNREWFEVYVAAAQRVDLNGVLMGKSRSSATPLPEGDCLEAQSGSYLIFAQSTTPELNGGLPRVDALFDFSLTNNNAGLYLGLEAQLLDAVSYTTSHDGAASALEPRLTRADLNDVEDYWCAALETYGDGGKGSPGSANASCDVAPLGQCYDQEQLRDLVPPRPGDLVITEVMADPKAVADGAGEWFELYVAADVDLNGLQLGKTAAALTETLRAAECLRAPAGTSQLFAHTVDTALNGGLPTVNATFALGLTNTDGGLAIGHAGELLDAFAYPTSTAGAAWSLDPAHTSTADNDTLDNWCAATTGYGTGAPQDRGTPGQLNPSCP